MQNPSPTASRSGLRRALRSAAALLAGVLVTTCADNPTAPNRPGFGAVRIQPAFDQYAQFAPLLLNQVRAIIVRPPSDTLVDTLRAFNLTDNQLRLSLNLPLQARSETMDVTLQLLSGQTLLFAGTEAVEVRQGATPPATSIPVTYQGPGANATSLVIGPRDTTLRINSTVQMRAAALDIEGVDVGQFYLSWSIVGSAPGASVDPTGLLHTPTAAGTFFVRGITPGGLRDSVQVTAIPAPATLAKSAGDNQTGLPGARLAQPLAVLVTGAGSVPVPGVSVTFAATTGGGTVDSATATTNAQGIALSGATLGQAAGAQTFTVSSTGLTAVVFTATAQTAGPQTRNWSGAVSTDWSVAGNWVENAVPGISDAAIIGTATRQPSLTATTAVGNVTINTGGVLTVNGQTLVIGGNLTTAGTGILKMTNVGDGVGVTGNAVFGGGDETGSLTAGVLQIGGNFSQTSGSSTTSYRATGTHATAFTGAAPVISFASPAQAGASFQDLVWTTATGTNTVTLQSALFVNGSFTVGGTGSAGFSSSGGQRITVRGDFATTAALVFNNVPLTIDQATAGNTIFTNGGVTFQGMATTVSQLVIRHPGQSSPIPLPGLTFSTVPVAPNGFYLDVTDVAADANLLTVDVTGATPASGGTFVKTTGGAIVNWPPNSAVKTWTGAVSTAWGTAGNWNGGVPGASDSAVIPLTTNAPQLSTATTVGAVTITGGVLSINGNGLSIARNLTITGGGVRMIDVDETVSVGGNATFGGDDTGNLLTGGELTIAGNFTQLSTVSPFSFDPSGTHITLFTTGAHTISFASPGAPSGSGFADVEFAGNGTVTLATAAWVRGTLDVNAAGQVFSSSNGSRLGVELLVATAAVTFNNVPLVINQTQQTSITNQPLTFQNMAPNVVQLEINHPGSSSPLTLNGFVFSTVPSAPNGFYLSASDNSADANPLVINMTGATPASGAPFFQSTAGATVNWSSASTLRTWTGGASTDWNNPANWVNGVPQPGDDVEIGDTSIQDPTLSTSASIRNLIFTTEGATVRLTVASPAILSLTGNASGGLRVIGSGLVQLTGGATHGIEGEIMALTTADAVTLTNSLGVSGDLNITGGQFDARDVQVFVNGNITTSGSGTIQTNAGSFFSIDGNLTFGGGPSTGLIQGGYFGVRKNFVVTGTNAGFAPGDGTTVSMAGTTAQQVSLVNASSFFENFSISNSADAITLANNITVLGTLSSGQAGTRLAGSGVVVTVNGELNLGGVTFDGVRLLYSSTTAATLMSMDNLTFTNYSAAAPQLEINHPGLATPLAFDGLVFSGTANPFFLRVNDNNAADGVSLTVNLTNATPANGTGLFDALNGASVGWPPGPSVWAWTGSTSTNWSVAGNWDQNSVPPTNASVTIGAAANQPTLTADVTVAGVVISTAGARLTLGGHTLTTGGLTTHTDGLLVMNNPADRLIATGDVFFQGGDETGLLTAGELRINGDFTQQVQTTPNSFVASGSHRTIMTNPGQLQGVRFCCTANTSRFMNLDISQSAGINIQFAGNGVFVADTFIVQPGAGPAPRLYMLGSPFQARRLKVNKLIVDRGTLTLNENGVAGNQQFDSVTFENYLTTQTQFAVIAPGGSPRTLTFNNLVFQTLAAGNTGRYVNATSTAGTLTLDLSTANVANGPDFTTTAGGAVVTWPGPPSAATWTGAVSTAWENPANWDVGAVPGNITAVTIPAGTPNAPTVGAVVSSAGNLTVNTGATLTLVSPFNLAVSGNVDAQGTIAPNSQALSMIGANVTLRGNVPQLTVSGIVTLNGNTTAASNGPCVFNGTAELIVNGFTFSCFQLQFNNTARIQMTNPADSVVVLGSTQFSGGSTLGRLTAGVLDLRGSFQQQSTNSITSFASTGTRVRVGGSGTNTVTMQNGGSGASRFTALLVNKSAGALNLSGPVVALDSVSLTSVTSITGSALLITPRLRVPAGASVQLSQLQVNGNNLSIGTPASFTVGTTILDGSGGPQTIPVLPYQTLYLRGGVPHIPAARITTANALFVVGGSLELSGQTVQTGAGLIVDSTGALIMHNPGDSMLVGGNAFFQQTGDATGNLTAGVLQIGANLSVSSTPQAFVASGGHRTVFTDTLSYTVQWTGIGIVPLDFQNLDVRTTNGRSTSFNWARAKGSMTVTGTGGINADELEVRGLLTTAATAGMGVNKLTLGNATPIAPGSGFINARVWVLDGVGAQTMPAIPAPSGPDSASLVVRSQTGFISDMTLNGLRIEGDGILEINEQTVNVFGDFATADNGRLFMQYALSKLNITGATTFGGGNTSGTLTNGILTVSGRFTQDGTNSQTSFQAIGEHLTRIATNYPGGNVVTFGTPQASAFFNLEVAVPVTWASDILIFNDFTNSATGAMSPQRFAVQGTFAQTGNSAFTPRKLVFYGPAINVTNGSLVPDTVQFRDTPIGFTWPVGARYTWNHAIAEFNATVNLAGSAPALTSLELGNTATLKLNGINMTVPLLTTSGTPTILGTGSASVFTARRLQSTGLTVDNARLVLDEQGTTQAQAVSNLTFQNLTAPGGTGLFTVTAVGNNGTPRTIPLGVNYSSTLAGGEKYLTLDSSNTQSLTAAVTSNVSGAAVTASGGATPTIGQTVNGATITWP